MRSVHSGHDGAVDAHRIHGTACDESLGDQRRVTVIANAKVAALVSKGMGQIEIPAFRRMRADGRPCPGQADGSSRQSPLRTGFVSARTC